MKDSYRDHGAREIYMFGRMDFRKEGHLGEGLHGVKDFLTKGFRREGLLE
jgi:hypothetical protein